MKKLLLLLIIPFLSFGQPGYEWGIINLNVDTYCSPEGFEQEFPVGEEGFTNWITFQFLGEKNKEQF